MTDRELLENVRTKALAYEFSHRWGVLEICRRYEKALQEREERARWCERCLIFENDPQFLFSRGNGQYDEVIFKYCPVCGRPLKTAMPGEEV